MNAGVRVQRIDNAMLIIPAIDLLDAQVVRLTRGSYDLVTVYSDKPGDVAKKWQDLGAKLIHVVDLNAAKEGKLRIWSLSKIY